MAKLTGKKKAEFLKRMAAGRRKARHTSNSWKTWPTFEYLPSGGKVIPLRKTKKAKKSKAAKTPKRKNAKRRVGGPIKCPRCGKTFKTQGGFDAHKCKAKNPKRKKLTGRLKAEFLRRMEKGRKKARRQTPKRKAKKNARPVHRKLPNSALKRGAQQARRANKVRGGMR